MSSRDSVPAAGPNTPTPSAVTTDRPTVLVDHDKLYEILTDLCQKAYPEHEDEEGGVAEMVGDTIAALRARGQDAAGPDTPREPDAWALVILVDGAWPAGSIVDVRRQKPTYLIDEAIWRYEPLYRARVSPDRTP